MPSGPRTVTALNARIIVCAKCPRLRRHCAAVASAPRRAYASETYWGRPVPTSGNAAARLWIVGLAPAAHGANRTGRMFTGDRSGDFLFAALHRAGFASQPVSRHRDDGTRLIDCAISAAVRCAPPQNRPAPAEVLACRAWLEAEWELFTQLAVVLALGAVAFDQVLLLMRRHGLLCQQPRPRFRHGLHVRDPRGGPALLASYHVSQQNTFTGRLTPAMLNSVLDRVRRVLDGV